MRRLVCAIAVLGFGYLSADITGLTQVRPLAPPPDLSGTWATTATDAPGYSPLGVRFVAKQDASTITLTTDRESVTYTFDDSDNVRKTQTVRGDTWTRTSRARFVTYALVVTTRIDAGATGHWEDLFVVTLNGPGEITVVSCNTLKSMSPGMSTRTFKYTKVE